VIGFHRRGERIVADLGEPEAVLLRQAAGQMLELLGADPDDPASSAVGDPLEQLAALSGPLPEPPSDPALARLFPDALRDDPVGSAELRRLTEDSLRAGKVRRMRALRDGIPATGGRVQLDDATADDWLRAFTDVRLVLGERLAMTEETDPADVLREALSHGDDATAVTAALYHLAGLLSETLVEALTAR